MLLSSLKFLLRQGLAVTGHDEIEGNLMQLLLCCEQNSNLKVWIKDKKYFSSHIINHANNEQLHSKETTDYNKGSICVLTNSR